MVICPSPPQRRWAFYRKEMRVVKGFLKEISEEKRYGILKYRGREILVKFWESEGELVGAFFLPEKTTSDGILFSAEIYRAVGKKENVDGIIEDLEEHIESILK